MNAYVLSVVGAVLAIGFILEMLRRGRLREKYAVLWLFVGVAVLVIGVAPQVLTGAADLLGVAVPANLLFFVAGLALLIISVQQSSEISRLEEETRTLAEEVALLNMSRQLRDPRPPEPGRRPEGTGPDHTT